MEYIPFSNYWNHLARFGDICIRKETCYKNQEQSWCVTKTNISFIILMKIIHLLHIGYFANLWVTDECSGMQREDVGSRTRDAKNFPSMTWTGVLGLFFFFFNWRRIYKRQQQNFLLVPRLGIPLKNKVTLAFSCTWVRPGLRGSAHLFLWWNTLGAPPAVPQGQSHPAVCWATRGWAVWKAVATFGLLNTRETWSSWSSSSDKDAEGLEHLPAQERLRELGLFSLQRSHLGTILVQVGTGDAGQHQNSRNNIQCLSRHFWKDYYAEMQLNQNTFSKQFWRCQVIDIWN